MAISTIESKDSNRDWSIDAISKSVKLPSINLRITKKVSAYELIFFMDQLSLMLETGTPLNKSIQSIGLQVKNVEFRNILKAMEKDIEGGRLLSDTLLKYPDTFNTIYISMIRAGESGGFLKEMLDRIVILEKRHQEFMATIRAALYYPAFLSIFAVSVILFIIIYVFPKFGEMFEEIHDSLPITTRILMGSSKVLVSYWYLIIIFIAISWFAAYKIIISDKGRSYIDNLKLKVPIFRDLFIKIYISRFTRTLGSLINSNVPLLDSLTICSGAVGNKVFATLIDNIRANVEGGKPLSKPVTESQYFPEIVKQMIRTGEDAGMLHKVMPRLADYYDEEIGRNIKKVTMIMEPLLLVTAGGIIGIIVISLIMPIFKLTKTLH
ncbi:MAG: hypothetical protein A2Z60_00425 [Nitrospirae bacterium RIFCSPLOWO2_02_42_7]|nr:MAG: hypothetical protein A2Z60_00425 [Nitrospirae bacterium RIFCSPLOWO2_02_42_7]